MNIAEMREHATAYNLKLDAAKEELLPSLKLLHTNGFYPYGTLHVVRRMDETLTGRHRNLLDLVENGTVLDLGCGDGDLSFFMESLGVDMHAIDNAYPNFNAMHGVRLLKGKLDSDIELFETNMDKGLQLQRVYNLTFMFGVLYHLKNPYGVMEELCEGTNYCVMSTKVTKYNKRGPGRIDMSKLPVAYLADYGEINNDPSNVWIFTEMGFKRLLKLTGWVILDYKTFGPDDSDPSTEGDQRVFCLLQSTRRTKIG